MGVVIVDGLRGVPGEPLPDLLGDAGGDSDIRSFARRRASAVARSMAYFRRDASVTRALRVAAVSGSGGSGRGA